MADVRASLGAILLGSLLGALLSGIVAMQVFLYFKLYSDDPLRFRGLVLFIWLLDILHTAMACASNWSYLIAHFGDDNVADSIMWPTAVTVALTAFITFFVQSFFAYRIFTLSKNWFITLPIGILTTARLAAALVSTSKMIELGHFSEFVHSIGWVFTMGLSLATTVDVMVTFTLCWYLNKSRTGFQSMEAIVDSIILYTIETNSLTCITTAISLICWISMPRNLIFLGLHFGISKLYANTLLATLNARKALRGRSESTRNLSEYSLSLVAQNHGPGFIRRLESSPPRGTQSLTKTVQIRVEETVQHHVDASYLEPKSFAEGRNGDK